MGTIHSFDIDLKGVDIPSHMGNPWGYKVGELCEIAVRVFTEKMLPRQVESGKTFGVMVVKKQDGALGWICAFSGLLNGENMREGFVPPVFDWTNEGGYFRKEELQISSIKDSGERRRRSSELQKWLFAQYRVTNCLGEQASILDIWAKKNRLPPGGTGDCCAPKMIEYALKNGLVMVAMAEFRFDENGMTHYVPSCQEKCGPLLRFMLMGLKLKRKVKMNVEEPRGRVERHPLGLFLPKGARFLMLGSFPPKRNRWCMDFYYPNWLNDMWRIQGIVWFNDAHFFEVKNEKRFDKERIVRFLKEKKIALGDTALKVIRENDDSSDLHLKVVEKLNFGEVLRKAPDLKVVISTGGKSAELFCEIAGIAKVPKTGESVDFEFAGRQLTFYRMVSSSRAYPMKLEEKAKRYGLMNKFASDSNKDYECK